MKKLTLTFCALFALFAAAAALYADDGPERVSSKEKQVMQPAPPVCDFYRAHEWDLDLWAAWAFAADTGQFPVNEGRDAEGNLLADPFVHGGIGIIPPSFDTDPFVHDTGTGFFGEPKAQNPNERVNIGQVSRNELFARDDTGGGGVDVKYFWSKYFGGGLEFLGLAAKRNFAGGLLGTLTARYPLGRFAPYATGGIGFIDGGATTFEFFNEKSKADTAGFEIPHSEREFLTTDPVNNNHVRALGQLGAGLEFRATCHIGLMADFTWNFVFGQEDHEAKTTLITEQGNEITTRFGRPVSNVIVINTAEEVRPGHGSDNQDFGLVRFGITFSY
jgi:hypothetical protein